MAQQGCASPPRVWEPALGSSVFDFSCCKRALSLAASCCHLSWLTFHPLPFVPLLASLSLAQCAGEGNRMAGKELMFRFRQEVT